MKTRWTRKIDMLSPAVYAALTPIRSKKEVSRILGITPHAVYLAERQAVAKIVRLMRLHLKNSLDAPANV